MKGALTIIPVDPKAAVTRKELTAAPRLGDLKAAIGGGYIEPVPYFDHYLGEPCVAFCDEDGKRKRMPINSRASGLWYAQEPRFMGRDVLVGPIAIVSGQEVLQAMKSEDEEEPDDDLDRD